MDADGSRKPPPPDLREYEYPLADEEDSSALAPDKPPPPEPLTDPEYADHVREVESRLEQARSDGLATDEQYALDDDREVWSSERGPIHDAIIEDLYARAATVPNERQAIIAGGLPGAGKSTILAEYAGIDRSQYLTIDPDMIKDEMARRGLVPPVEGVTPMEASDLVHEESSYLAKLLAYRAQADGKNVIWDITMSSRASAEERIDKLRSADYTRIEGIFVDISLAASEARTRARHREGLEEFRSGKGHGGRFVGADVIERQADPDWGSVNRKTFEEVKHRFYKWSGL